MIRRGLILAGAVAAVFAAAPWARAATMADKLVASTYNVKLVPAFDECASGVTNVLGLPACDPATTQTDGTAFNSGKIVVKHKSGPSQVLGILSSSGVGKTLAGKDVNIRLVLRITRSKGTPLVTWEDQTLDCPSSTVPATGNVVMKASLQDCGLPPGPAAETTYKEIVSAAIVDADTGLPIAVPGVRNKP